MPRASSYALALLFALSTAQAAECAKPVYLTLDTGHMGVAELVAEVLNRQQVKVTFFAANERTKEGEGSSNGSLGAHWSAWWRARAAEGHAFASHTLNHTYWRADVPPPQGDKGSADGSVKFRVRASAGAHKGQDQVWSAAQYCAEIGAASARLREVTGTAPLPLYRAPGGKTSPALLAAARTCDAGGYLHVGWSEAGFLGDELPSDKYPNDVLLQKALRDIRPGDVLMAHLGIWSRQDAWAPAVLEPLIAGLKQRGFCFQTLREHPDYRGWIASHPSTGK